MSGRRLPGFAAPPMLLICVSCTGGGQSQAGARPAPPSSWKGGGGDLGGRTPIGRVGPCGCRGRMRSPTRGGQLCMRWGVGCAAPLVGGNCRMRSLICDCGCGPPSGGARTCRCMGPTPTQRPPHGAGREGGGLVGRAALTNEGQLRVRPLGCGCRCGPRKGAHTHSRRRPAPDLGEGREGGRPLNSTPPLPCCATRSVRVHARTDTLGHHVQFVVASR